MEKKNKYGCYGVNKQKMKLKNRFDPGLQLHGWEIGRTPQQLTDWSSFNESFNYGRADPLVRTRGGIGKSIWGATLLVYD